MSTAGAPADLPPLPDEGAPALTRQMLSTLVTWLPSVADRRDAERSAVAVAADMSPLMRSALREELTQLAAVLGEDVLDRLAIDGDRRTKEGASVLKLYANGSSAEATARDAAAAPDPSDPQPSTPVGMAEPQPPVGAVNAEATDTTVAMLWASACAAPLAERERLLAELAALSPTSLSGLASTALDSSDETQYVLGLAAVASIDDGPIQPLIDALAHPAPDTRRVALRGLGRRAAATGHDGHDEDVALAIAGRLTDPDPAIRADALSMLTEIDAPRFLDAMVDAAADPVEQVRARAVEVIASVATEDVIDRLVAMLNERGDTSGTTLALCAIGQAVVPALISALHADGPAGRVASVLREIGPGPTLRVMLADRSPTQRLAAAEAIAILRGPDTAEMLSSLLQDPVSTIRERVVELLGELGDTSATGTLRRAQATEPIAKVRSLIDRALRRAVL